ncbi:PopZ family protein [Rhizobium sp. 814_E9_N1_1]|uniref:PopZ family protein n=1 Tax=unclassified Rhizobium TaxID=2613769 RepID=UPI003F1E81FC
MAQPSVAREPSMEEILASIRQIIESNEPGAGKAISASLPPVYGADEDDNGSEIHLTVDDTYAGVEFPEPVMRSSDPRFVAANSAGTAPEAEVPARALSLADVAARVRAASERSAVQAGQALREIPSGFRQPEPPPAVMPEPPRAAAPQPQPQPIFPAAAAPVQHVAIQQPAEPVSTETPGVAVAEPAPAVETAPPAMEPAQSSTERFLPSVLDEVQPTLLSEDAGLQISRSFEELAAAIDGAERRSLDEIAEDMLRPMLREWLDDNLPTLVERLVREEIERVARGPRR